MTSPISVPSPELRFDPISQQAVFIAPKRAKRPLQHEAPQCPGCIPALTPPAVYVYPEDAEPDGDDWEVRVVPNKFSCFSDAGDNRRYESAAGFKGIHDPAGRCEVLFETRRHSYPIYARGADEIENCFRALISRYKSARSDPHAKCFFPFKNLGRSAGGTLDHEHWQLYTLPFVPPAIQDRYARAARYFNETGQNIFQRVFQNEEDSGDRVVAATDRFLTFVPFAAAMPYEICISPRKNSADFSAMTDEELHELAVSFRDALSRLNSVHPELALNVALQTAAFEHAGAPWFTWHLCILPRLTTIAGVELGIDIMINPVRPEDAASALRGAQ
jgi:UDPglucose--hexose-1-phosphate uridylyltransferase